MRQSRTEVVADGFLDLILDGTFPPGSPLPSEAVLAERFDVSRLTVREAIRSLASTRVIDVQQGKSSVVNPVERWSPLDPRLLLARGEATGQPLLLPRRLIEARRTVEVGVTELAATRRTEEQITRMADFLELMKQAHRDTDVPRFVEADLAFHATLFQAVDNVFIDALFEPLTAVLRTLRATTSAVPEIREHAIDWHGRVLAAVSAGDPDRAREAMRGHLLQTEEDADQYLTASDQAAAARARPISPAGAAAAG